MKNMANLRGIAGKAEEEERPLTSIYLLSTGRSDPAATGVVPRPGFLAAHVYPALTDASWGGGAGSALPVPAWPAHTDCGGHQDEAQHPCG